MTHTPRAYDGGPIPPDDTTVTPSASVAEYPSTEDLSRTPDTTDFLGTSADSRSTGHTATSANTSASTADVAKSEATAVKDTAVDAGKNVAATAKDEAANVVADTKAQAKNLLGSVTSEVRDQAGSQQQKIAASVHSLSQELTGMASGSAESGPLTDLAQQAAQKGGEIAQWLEDREPSDVLAEVKSFARRRPVTFLALCGLAGVVAGRLTRGAVAANTSIDSPSTHRTSAPRAVESGQPMPARELPATPLYDEILDANPDLAAPDRGYQAGELGYQDDRSGGMR
ncbi:MAG TPA: hypothetical protein VIT65_20370 [Microlunatus sp.]